MLIKSQYTTLELLLAFWFIHLVARVAKVSSIHPLELIIFLPLIMLCTYVILKVVYTFITNIYLKVK